MEKKRKKRINLGDIYAIPLPDGKYAFGRVMKDAGIAIYKDISNNPHDIPTVEEYQFIVGVYRDVLQSGDWQIVDNRKFNNEEEAWPPKTYIKDVTSGEYSIYYKGEIIKSTEEECKGLERAAVWEGCLIIDRIMRGNK